VNAWVQPVGPPLGVTLPGPPAEPLGAIEPDGPGVVGFVPSAGPVGAVVDGAEDPPDEPVEGVLGVEPESEGVEGIELGEELPDPDGVGEGESGFGDGAELCVPPPGFSCGGWLSEPLP